MADLGPRWASLELVGAFILSFSPNNPVRRWLENSWAQTEANREVWQVRRDAEWAIEKKKTANLRTLLLLDRQPTDTLH